VAFGGARRSTAGHGATQWARAPIRHPLANLIPLMPYERALTPLPPDVFGMARLLVMAHCMCCWLEVLFRPRPWLTRTSTGDPPETTLHLWTFACCYSNSMPRHKLRLRGRPRQGSPWRPRRPMAPPSEPPPTKETTHLLALVPQSHGSAWRVLHSLSMTEPPGSPFMAPPGTSATQHPSTSRGQPRENCTPANPLHGEQLKDKISILHGLVFDLRQGVEDLRFRLELNTEKIELFLQLLSSLHAVVPTDPGGATSKPEPMDDFGVVQADERKEPGATTHDEEVGMQSNEVFV
jgi:hypothetical protein